MDSIDSTILFWSLIVLIIVSGFFSSSETGMMAINRYRLRHLAQEKHKGARRVSRLLERPDRLIGIILIGNNFVNIFAASIATILAMRIWGDGPKAILISSVLFTFVVLIFAELTPKTLAALKPEPVAFASSWLLSPLLKIFYPCVWFVNLISNGLLKLFGVKPHSKNDTELSSEELRTVVNEAGTLIPVRHQNMLLSILDLEKVTVDDIMVPRQEIVSIDLEDSIDEIREMLANSQHTRLVVFTGEIDNTLGMLHARDTLQILMREDFSKELIKDTLREIYYVPSKTPLNTQLLNFQRKKSRTGLVVNEYGDIQGLVTLEDILEEIVGEFTTDFATISKDVHPQEDGSFLVEGSATIRDLNKSQDWELPADGPKTLSGLIIEYLENIPSPGTSVKIAGYPMEIIQVKDNMIKSVKVYYKFKNHQTSQI